MLLIKREILYLLIMLLVILSIGWIIQFDEIRSLERKVENVQQEKEYNNQFTFIIEGN